MSPPVHLNLWRNSARRVALTAYRVGYWRLWRVVRAEFEVKVLPDMELRKRMDGSNSGEPGGSPENWLVENRPPFRPPIPAFPIGRGITKVLTLG